MAVRWTYRANRLALAHAGVVSRGGCCPPAPSPALFDAVLVAGSVAAVVCMRPWPHIAQSRSMDTVPRTVGVGPAACPPTPRGAAAATTPGPSPEPCPPSGSCCPTTGTRLGWPAGGAATCTHMHMADACRWAVQAPGSAAMVAAGTASRGGACMPRCVWQAWHGDSHHHHFPPRCRIRARAEDHGPHHGTGHGPVSMSHPLGLCNERRQRPCNHPLHPLYPSSLFSLGLGRS